MKKSILLVTSVIGMLVFLTKPISAQDMEYYKQQVIGYLNRTQTVKSLLSVNFKFLRDGLKVGYIKVGPGNSQDAYYDLVQGYAYAFVGKCDEDCNDLDFVLYDPDGNKIAVDSSNDDTPVVWWLVSRTGTYTVRATTPKCTAPIGCYWAVQALFK